MKLDIFVTVVLGYFSYRLQKSTGQFTLPKTGLESDLKSFSCINEYPLIFPVIVTNIHVKKKLNRKNSYVNFYLKKTHLSDVYMHLM